MHPERQIVGLVGFKGSGKSTAAKTFVDLGYASLSYGDVLKDVLAVLFGWPRELLEGDTEESREWREAVDEWWSIQLGRPNFTPRRALQEFATETVRDHFHPDMWVIATERRISALPAMQPVVIPDVRFPNEINLVRRRKGALWRVRRGADPDWFEMARLANNGDEGAETHLRDVLRVHQSEYRWIGTTLDGCFENDGDKANLEAQVMRAFGPAPGALPIGGCDFRLHRGRSGA